jgi:hypothetical protein
VTLRLGQIEILQFLLLAVAMYALTRRSRPAAWDFVGGAALGLAAAIKFFPAALVVLLLWRRRWRPALWALVIAGTAIGGSFALVGKDALSSYARFAGLYGFGGAFAAFPYNQSLNGVISRNLVHNVFGATLKGWHRPMLALGLIIIGTLIVVSLSAWLTWHRAGWPEQPSAEERDQFALEYGLGVVALLIVSPHSQVYAYVWALIPLISSATWLLQRRLANISEDRGGARRWWPWFGLIVADLLIGRHMVLYKPGLTRFVQSHYFFGAAALWATLAAILQQWRLDRWSGTGDASYEADPRPSTMSKGA